MMAVLSVALVVSAWVQSEPASAQPGPVQRITIGYSVQGRPLEAVVLGAASARRTVVVVGSVHGDEPGGLAVTDVLTEILVPSWLRVVVIPTLNPDGLAAGTRGNANGVDLNRNADHNWLPEGASEFTVGGYYPGPFPGSEPETVAITNYLAALRPHAVLWYHQPWGSVLCADGRTTEAWCPAFAVAVGLPTDNAPRPGSLSGWSAGQGFGSAVVEFPEGSVDRGTALGHAAAILRLYTDPGRSGPRWVRNPVSVMVMGPANRIGSVPSN
ncbi:MAG: DUF2817 domain-containing protein [Acidimicrobiales bacterium]